MKNWMIVVVFLVVALVAAPAIAQDGESTNQAPPASDGPGTALPKAADQEPTPPSPPPTTEETPTPPPPLEPVDQGAVPEDGNQIPDTSEGGTIPSPGPGAGVVDSPNAGTGEDITNTDTGNAGDDTGAVDGKDDGIVEGTIKDADNEATKDEDVVDTNASASKNDKDRKGDNGNGGKDGKKDDGKKDKNNAGNKGDVKQSTDQDVQSGDANQNADVINTGDNVNQCVAILQIANTGNATNANGVAQVDSDSGEVQLEDGATITITPKLVLKCRQVIRQVVKSERLNDSDAKKLRNLIQSGSGTPVVRTGNGSGGVPNRISGIPGRASTGAAVSTNRLGAAAAAPKILSASGAGQPKASTLRSLPRTGGSYATLLGLGAGALLVGGGLLVRRLAR